MNRFQPILDGVRTRGLAVLLFFSLWALVSCAGNGIHKGRPPFSFLESSPRGSQVDSAAMTRLLIPADQLKTGDVIAFWMGHGEALAYLRRGVIQKVPYEVFQYGHLAMVVEAPGQPGEKRLLQVAMGEAVNIDHDLGYLDDKQWVVFRPPHGSLDHDRLEHFVGRVTTTASDPKRAYDYAGILGWKNAPFQPEEPEHVGSRYSCATLVVAALHYSGYELDAVHRGGRLDVVTPRQVVGSRGSVRD